MPGMTVCTTKGLERVQHRYNPPASNPLDRPADAFVTGMSALARRAQ
jgi:hypothetical protein